MNPHPHSSAPDGDSIEATAAAWLARRDGGMTAENEEEFARWRQADARHAAAVARLEIAWNAVLQLRDFRPEAQQHPDRDLLTGRRRRGLNLFPTLAVATAAAALAAIVLWKSPRLARVEPALPRGPHYAAGDGGAPTTDPQSEQHYATTDHGYQRITLSDGSVIELNATSEISVRYTVAERRLVLVHGEAHFSVAKNKNRPFWVQAGAVSVRAVGTAFDVLLGQQAVEVLVTEGRVQVTRADLPSSKTTAPATEVAVLNAGQQADVPLAAGSQVLSRVAAPDAIDRALAWQEPRLVFADTPLAEAVEQFNQRNSVKLMLDGPDLGAMPIDGSFRAENVEAFVRLLTRGGEITATRLDPDHIVLHSAK